MTYSVSRNGAIPAGPTDALWAQVEKARAILSEARGSIEQTLEQGNPEAYARALIYLTSARDVHAEACAAYDLAVTTMAAKP